MSFIIDNQDIATKELEAILNDCGFMDWESIRPATETQYEEIIKQQTAPIYYRATTPAEAANSIIKKMDSVPKQAGLFLLYTPTAYEYLNGDNVAQAIQIKFSLTLQYNNKFLFWKNSGAVQNKFVFYLNDLVDKLQDAKFGIAEVIPEQPLEDTNISNKFAYRRQFIITKIYGGN
jgi:hypothetical protein